MSSTSGKKVSVKYTNRDFDSIKNDLVNYAKKYYPNQLKDFNEGSFGSLLLDTVAYVGDSLSFYLDYQVNESFLQNAMELRNILRHSRQLGYKPKPVANSFGTIDLYIAVPASTTDNNPDTEFLPIIRRGSKFASPAGTIFSLARDVDFSNSNTIFKVSRVNSDNVPIEYVLKNSGVIVSGQIITETYTIGDFVKFNKLYLNDTNITEIISIVDDSGNEYFQVEFLSQDVIHKLIANSDPSTAADVPSVLKPMAVPRRYVLERDEYNNPYLQFGSVSNKDVLNKDFIDPNEVVMELHGRDYITDNSFDPSNMFINDKFGIAPSNTTLTITYRSTNADNVNVPAGSLTTPVDVSFSFKNEISIPSDTRDLIVDSIESDNPSPITGDINDITVEEARILALDSFATQNRAVTKNDYISLVYRMPPDLGGIKRVNVFQDNDSLKRNINLYVLSENSDGNLTRTSGIIKNNLKTWLNQYKMINDSIDILDAHIVNIGIDFSIIAQPNINKYDALVAALQKLQSELLTPKFNIGEPFLITDIYKHLKDVDEVLDVVDVKIINRTSILHSGVYYDIQANKSSDGRVLNSKENICLEIKYADDIKGVVL